MPSGVDVLIIGGGPAGMTAAAFAKAAGARVLLIEHNEKLGKKLYITGKGRCNLSNLCELEEFLEHVPRNPRFLYAALDFMPPQKLRDWLDILDCPSMVERGKRVFPVSQKASDVTRALAGNLLEKEFRLKTKAVSLMIQEGRINGVRLSSGDEIHASAVVLATGGLSYPLTGSTGDGHQLAIEAGHRVSELYPSLTGLETEEEWPRNLQGLTLKNVNVTLSSRWPEKGRFREQGEVLFTHFGVSGPLVLMLSSYLSGLPIKDIEASIDLKPAVEEAVLSRRLESDAAQGGRKSLQGLLHEYMPSRLAALFPEIAGVPGTKPVSQLSAQERERLVFRMKHLSLHISRLRPFSEAVITRGGVNVKEVNPSTMESRLVKGLYFAGELLDVDALTGGFNLQIAFSTGALAGHSAGNSAINTD